MHEKMLHPPFTCWFTLYLFVPLPHTGCQLFLGELQCHLLELLLLLSQPIRR